MITDAGMLMMSLVILTQRVAKGIFSNGINCCCGSVSVYITPLHCVVNTMLSKPLLAE